MANPAFRGDGTERIFPQDLLPRINTDVHPGVRVNIR
jgi:hypothetical protein